MADYIELHCHSAFSLLDGASHPEALVERACALGYGALALTDHDELGGAVAFAQAGYNAGLECIIGAEITVAVERDGAGGAATRPARDSTSKGQPARGVSRHPSATRPLTTHLVLLAESREGYGNLSTIITRARMESERGRPRVSLDILARHARGLYALTGCPRGWVPRLVARGDLDGACEAVATLRDIFGEEHVAIECWDHGLEEERRIVAGLIQVAHAFDIPWVVTNDVHYAAPAERVVHDVLCALRHESTLDEMGTRLRPNGEWYLKRPAQMRRRWQHAPEGVRATLAIAERCTFRMRELRPTLPAFPLPPGVSADEYLARLVEQGAWERWGSCRDEGRGTREAELRDEGQGTRDEGTAHQREPDSPERSAAESLAAQPAPTARLRRAPAQPPSPAPQERGPLRAPPSSLVPRPSSLHFLPPAHRKQIAHELATISRLNLAGYFLIVWDIVRFAHRVGVMCQGRGSAANSAVCFCLGITAVDPIKLGLLFERFLSEERQEAPDIDIDFAHRDREKVLQYVYERYGREHAAMVCEQISYRGRSAVRDACRVLGFSVEQADTLAMLSDRFSARATAEAMRDEGQGTRDEGTAHQREPDSPERSAAESLAAQPAPTARLRRAPAQHPSPARQPADSHPAHPAPARHAPPASSASRFPLPASPSDADRIGTHLVHGTEVVNRIRQMDESERRARDARIAAMRAEREAEATNSRSARIVRGAESAPARAASRARESTPHTAHTDRRGRDAEMQSARKARPKTPSDRPKPNAAYEPYGSPSAQSSGSPWLDPYAGDDHVERRNPTTALRSTRDESAAAAPSPVAPESLAAPASDPRHPTPAVPLPITHYPLPAHHEPRSHHRSPARQERSTPSLLTRAGLDPDDRRVRTLPAIVAGMHNIPRHRSIPVGGFVLTDEPLSTVVPIEPASMENRTVVQWDKDDVEAMGLVKIDLLGLGMLTLIQDCLAYVRQTRGVTIDLASLDYADQAVYDDLCRADTIGVFQVESRAQMNTLPRLKPRCFYDLVVEVALIRPGPIQGEMVHPYLRRRAGLEPVVYPHPALEPILARTLGVPLFQEQGMQVAIAAAGFTPGEADNLRRAMGHKRSRERMADICERMIVGMRGNGIPEETAQRIYNQINAFADYGFPESHAASFALLVYASAYLKHYYAPEFTAAILNAQPMGFYSPGTLIEDAKRHGVVVLPVDASRSLYDSTLEVAGSGKREAGSERRVTGDGCWVMGTTHQREPVSQSRLAAESRGAQPAPGTRHPTHAVPSPITHHPSPTHQARGALRAPPLPASHFPLPAVRLGLRLVRGLGAKAREKLQRAIESGGPFQSIEDVVHRSGLDRRALRALAEAGALDCFVPDEPSARRRRAAIWRMLEAERGNAGPLAPACRTLDVPSAVPAMSAREITAADYRMTGVSLNGHPMRHLRSLMRENGVRAAAEILRLPDGTRDVAMAGLVICRQRPGTAKGFVFLTLEDETGMVNVVVTPKRFERQALMISTAPLILVRGTLQVEQTVVNLRGETFRELKGAMDGFKGHDFH